MASNQRPILTPKEPQPGGDGSLHSAQDAVRKHAPHFAVRSLKKLSSVNEAFAYLVKAVVVVTLLMVTVGVATALPSVAFPFVFALYATLATLGALYSVMINRHFRQYKLNKSGTLSYYNRRWVFWMSGLFIASLASAFVFVLEAPSWDVLEWVLIWVAIPAYYVVFCLMRQRLKRELARKFYKAAAMRWSFIIVAVAMCIIYALISVLMGALDPAASEPLGLEVLVENRVLPFEHSACAVLSELDKLTSYADCLTAYGIGLAEGISVAVVILIKFLTFAFVFFGLVNQFGFCLLNLDEVKSEFRLLPATGERTQDMPLLKRYFLVLLGIWVAFAVVFLIADVQVAKVRSTSEYTAVDAFVEDTTKRIALMTDKNVKQIWNLRSLEDKRRVLQEQRAGSLDPLVNAYYDSCIGKVDEYLDWYDGFFVSVVRTVDLFDWFKGNEALKVFKEKVSDAIGHEELNTAFEQYAGELDQLYDEYSAAEETDDPNDPGTFKLLSVLKAQLDATDSLDLWIPLDEQHERSAKKTLLNASGADREEFKADLIALIEQARTDTFTKLNAM